MALSSKTLTDENFEKIIDIKDILSELGIPQGMPVIGWVFKEKWGKKPQKYLKIFLKHPIRQKINAGVR